MAYRVNRPRSQAPSYAQDGRDYRTLKAASPALKSAIRRSERFDKKARRHNAKSSKNDAVMKNLYSKSDEARTAAWKLAAKEGVEIREPISGGRASVKRPHSKAYKERKESRALIRKLKNI